MLSVNWNQSDDTNGEAEHFLIQDVHDAVGDLVELIKAYQSRNALSKVLMSTLFKRRQEQADAVIDRATSRLHVSAFSIAFSPSRYKPLIDYILLATKSEDDKCTIIVASHKQPPLAALPPSAAIGCTDPA